MLVLPVSTRLKGVQTAYHPVPHSSSGVFQEDLQLAGMQRQYWHVSHVWSCWGCLQQFGESEVWYMAGMTLTVALKLHCSLLIVLRANGQQCGYPRAMCRLHEAWRDKHCKWEHQQASQGIYPHIIWWTGFTTTLLACSPFWCSCHCSPLWLPLPRWKPFLQSNLPQYCPHRQAPQDIHKSPEHPFHHIRPILVSCFWASWTLTFYSIQGWCSPKSCLARSLSKPTGQYFDYNLLTNHCSWLQEHCMGSFLSHCTVGQEHANCLGNLFA